jgi:outer membrane protein OmpA-like peptidoglycan-associated protein
MRAIVTALLLTASLLLTPTGPVEAQERMRVFAPDNPSRQQFRDALRQMQSLQSPAMVSPSGMKPEAALAVRIEFDFGQASITPEGRQILTELADAFNDPQYVQLRFIIEGHTDSIGSPDGNLRLSDRRARSVFTYLTQLGVAPYRLQTIGYGQSRPLPGLPTTDGRNRRVEFVVVQ